MPDNGKSEDSGELRSIYLFFRSIKLAVTLLLIITATSILATLIPQGRDAAYYQAAYGRAAGKFITGLKFDNFFRSFLFLFPSALFLINLGVCSVDRLVGRIRRKMRKRFGPDILHLGLLILVAGGIVTVSGRQDALITLSEGDAVSIPGGYSVSLLSFEFHTYENGVPKDWISTVRVTKNGETEIDKFPIEVNKPLKIGKVKLYQSSYYTDNVLIIEDADGTLYDVDVDSIIPVSDGAYIFRGIAPFFDNSTVAVFDTWQDHKITGRIQLGIGESVGDYKIADAYQEMSTVLQEVPDPGYTIVFIALFIVIIGLCITYIQKIGDNQQ